jgi:hypothetical protein
LLRRIYQYKTCDVVRVFLKILADDEATVRVRDKDERRLNPSLQQ